MVHAACLQCVRETMTSDFWFWCNSWLHAEFAGLKSFHVRFDAFHVGYLCRPTWNRKKSKKNTTSPGHKECVTEVLLPLRSMLAYDLADTQHKATHGNIKWSNEWYSFFVLLFLLKDIWLFSSPCYLLPFACLLGFGLWLLALASLDPWLLTFVGVI